MTEPTLRQPFPFDPQIPELASAADASTMCRLLAQHVWTGNNPNLCVENCRITRIRYRPHTRCLLQYSVTLRDSRTAARRQQWVIGSLYAEPKRAARRARRMSNAVFIPELRMLVSLFPTDDRLPQSSVIMAGRDPALEAAILGTLGDHAWRIEAASVEPVRYREHLSLVVRHTVRARNTRSGESAERTFYLKAYPEREQAVGTFEYLRQLADRARGTAFGITIDSPIACLGHLRALLLPSAAGRPLSEMIRCDPDRVALAAARNAARGLARFNLSDLPMRRRYTSAEYIRSLERPAMVLEWACPELQADLRGTLAMVQQSALDEDVRPTHRDMKPEHILLDGDVAAFIDLDSSASADPALDVALMLARFRGAWGPDDVNKRRMEAISTAFHDEYFASVPARWRARLPAFYAGSLVEVAAGMFHRQEAGWQLRVRDLVRCAAQVSGLHGRVNQWPCRR